MRTPRSILSLLGLVLLLGLIQPIITSQDLVRRQSLDSTSVANEVTPSLPLVTIVASTTDQTPKPPPTTATPPPDPLSTVKPSPTPTSPVNPPPPAPTSNAPLPQETPPP